MKDLDFPFYSKERVDEIEGQVYRILSHVFSDNWELETAVDAILNDVVQDIYETSDWSYLEDDVVCLDDIDIAVARVVKKRLLGE